LKCGLGEEDSVDLAIDELKMEEFGVCVVGATLQFIGLSLFR
jgi:hypothetical protein